MSDYVTVRRADDDERYVATDHLVWFDEVGSTPPAAQLRAVPERFVADLTAPETDAREYAGLYAVRPMQLSIPGTGLTPVAGLTWVGVHPDHRRRGVLRSMLTHHVRQCRDEGRALSVLHASETAIYGRFGYGLAALELQVSLGRGTTFTAPHLEEEAARTTTTLVTITDPGVLERLRASDLACAGWSHGQIVGDQSFYDNLAEERPEEMRDKESWRVLFARRDGVDVGNAVLRRSQRWEQGRPSGRVEVHGPVGDQPARLALLRRLVDLDLISTTRLVRVGADDPLFAWVGGHRATGEVHVFDGTWVRLIDLAAAIPLRSYTAACDVVVEVSDAHAAWNAGRWRIRCAADGTGRATRTDAEAEVSLNVAHLGAAYLGAPHLASLLQAGVVSESRAGALAALARAFRTDLAPDPSYGF